MGTTEQMAEMFKVLSDPTRLRLVQLLAGDRTLCVNALARRLGVTQSAVSQHLRLLRQAGLVASARQGSFVHYSLKTDRLSVLRKRLRDIAGAGSAD
jgi:DNA-binding transcriptional ArsR family regulator